MRALQTMIRCCPLLWAAALPAAEPPAFLAGDWCAGDGARRFEERWTAPVDGRMHALARSLREGRLAGFEFLRIEPVDGSYTYFAQPGGGAPVPASPGVDPGE